MERMHNELHLYCPYCGSDKIAVTEIAFAIDATPPKVRHTLECAKCENPSWLDVSTERGFVKTMLIRDDASEVEARPA